MNAVLLGDMLYYLTLYTEKSDLVDKLVLDITPGHKPKLGCVKDTTPLDI